MKIIQCRIKEFLDEVISSGGKYYGPKPSAYPTGAAILQSDPSELIRFAVAASKLKLTVDHSVLYALSNLQSQILRKKLPYTEDDVVNLSKSFRSTATDYCGPETAIIGAVEKYVKQNPLPESAKTHLIAARKKLVKEDHGASVDAKAVARLNTLIGTDADVKIKPGEAWTDTALADLDDMSSSKRSAWAEVLGHCQSATSSAPSAIWRKTAQPLVEKIGHKPFLSCITKWFPLVDQPRTQLIEEWPEWRPDPNRMIIDPHMDVLKGLAWCCSFYDDAEIARALGTLAMSAYKKVPGIGPRAVRVGNACVNALGAMPGMDAVGQLALLKVRVKFGSAQKGIEKALTATAERIGIPREELEEMAVPAYGLTEVGRLTETMGEFTAQLTITGTTSSELVWIKPDGKTQKSVPAAIKKDHADDLKTLKAAVKDIQRMLPAQRDRIDNLFLEQKSWPFKSWRERYLDHPLVGTLARRMLWRFTTGKKTADGIWHDEKIVGRDDKPISELADNTTVVLWHPLDRDIEDIVAWRNWLDAHEVRQPFKQAHRELYLLTDAERNTGAYSNRYAAHVLRQHQFNALCGVRGWKNTLRLMVDADFPPATLSLPKWNLRAEFWIEGAGDEYGTDTNDTGTYLYLATDQVRFYPLDAAQRSAHAGGGGYHPGYEEEDIEPIPLEEIPPLVFSEVMRDVDLFVGVASVGNDPNWSDGGPEGRYRDYWQSFSFGDLSATAVTRKTVLERLIPRLKIADRCSFNEKFLVVRGDVRTYKIHLGSGNILMAPNDQYLCIVPKSSTATAADKLFLPFEGDRTMSIILSKAFLLAEDAKIRDATIVSQIKS